MLRPLLLLSCTTVAVIGQATDSCPVKGTVNVNICKETYSPHNVPNSADPTALTAPNWDCSGGALGPGLIVPFAVSLHNLIEQPSSDLMGGNPVWATSKILAGGTVTIRFSCSKVAKDSPECGGDAYTGVFAFQQYNKENAAVDNDFVPTAGGGTITINQEVNLAGYQEIYLGTIYTRVTSWEALNAELDILADPEFHARGDSSGDFLINTQTDVCLASSDKISGTNVGAFIIPSPPPPPAPVDCCSQANRNCLARCSTCVGAGAVNIDATGIECSKHCDTTCALYPNTDSKQCFARCSQCAQGTHAVDAEGQACTNPIATFCDSCIVYDKCMRAGVCTVGCVAGRRKRKLLFAPVPQCEPCCMPIV